MAFPGDVNSLGSVSGSQTLAAAGHATRHNEVKTALEGLRDVLGGTAVPSGTVQPILAAGSASAPSLSFTGDSNTGLWSPAADTLAASTGGTERMRVDNAGLITGTGTSLGAWTAYTPTLGGTSWSLGSGTATFRYVQIGKIVHVAGVLTFAADSGFGTGNLTLTLPANYASSGRFMVNAVFYDSSTGSTYQGGGYFASTNQISVRPLGTAGLHGTLNSTTPFTWATSDQIYVSATYEI